MDLNKEISNSDQPFVSFFSHFCGSKLSLITTEHYLLSLFLLANGQYAFNCHFLSTNFASRLVRLCACLNKTFGIELTAAAAALNRLCWQSGQSRRVLAGR